MIKDLNFIGLVLKLIDINIEIIWYYEKINLIDKLFRSEGGNRFYFDEYIW